MLRAAQLAPLALLLDDLQWADAGTLNLLNFLAPELATARILVIATQRDELASGDQRRLARLARHAERIELTRLTAEDVGRYMAEVTHAPEVPIVAMSAYAFNTGTAGPDFFRTSMERGATCCLRKPFTREQLLDAIAFCRASTSLVA